MKMAVGIATLGRPDALGKLTEQLQLQSRKPDKIFIAPVSDGDVARVVFDGKVTVRVDAAKGLTKQRNAVMRAAADCDLVVFFDDDFVPHNDYLKMVEQEFLNNPGTVIATGCVVADGARGRGYSFDEAVDFIEKAAIKQERDVNFFSAYGCNMAIRLSIAKDNNIIFDERLPSYGWLEDLDFTRKIAPYGRSIKISTAYGAHMAHKEGRVSGVKYGYSQVANPLYIAKKKMGFTYRMACKMFTKNIIANFSKSFKPEPYIDRRGRLKGNLLAFRDITVGRLAPERSEYL